MAILKIAKPTYNVDPIAKQGRSETIIDGYLDEAGCLNSRFGCDVFADPLTGAPGDGLFWWDKLGVPIAISAGRAFTFDQGGTVTEITGALFGIGVQATFAAGQKVDNSGFLAIANGGQINYTLDAVTLAQIASPAPQTVTHIIYNALRWLANETGTANVYFSDVDPATGEFDPLYWSAVENPLTSDTRGDNVEGLYQAWDDIAAWGSDGREIWQASGGSPPVETRLGVFCEAGLIAPYSVQRADNTFFALCNVDNKPVVIRLQANDPVVISEDIEKALDGYSTFNDAIGDVVSAGGQSFYILTFPAEDATWVYNIKKKEWYQWSYWNQADATRQAFMFRNFIYARQWGMHLCQSSKDGKIYQVTPDGVLDGSSKIRSEWQSSWFDGGTYADKILSSLRLMLKRGQGVIAGTEPRCIIRWRDNGKEEWKVEREISLGKLGHREFHRTLNGLGMFRSRQFSIILSDPAKLVLVGLEPKI